MKKLKLVMILFFIANILYSQDVIIKKDGNELKVKVIEINKENVKYKDYDYLEGPSRNIYTSEIFIIKYENGTKEVFDVKENIRKSTTPKQLLLELIPGSRLYLTFVNIPGERNVFGDDAIRKLKSLIKEKTKCTIEPTKSDADFIVELSVVKNIIGRKAKIDIIHVASGKKIIETGWINGHNSHNATYEAFKFSVLDEYPDIRKE